jgi:LPS sulfotransferase NodH
MVMQNLQFETIVRDLVVDQAAYDAEMSQTTPPEMNYVIIFMARSGSSWLTSLLSGTERLGHPEEYINPNFVREVARSLNSRVPRDFLKLLKRRRKTANGVFGIEARAHDIEHFGQRVFFEEFDETALLYNLWRENIFAQTVSLFRALATGRWHSYEADGGAQVPDYDADAIERLALQLLREENANIEMLQGTRRRFKSICYETMIEDRDASLRMFADDLAVGLDAAHFGGPKVREHTKIGDAWNDEIERRFRAERRDFTVQLENRRLIWRVPGA